MAPLFTGLKLGGFGKNPDVDVASYSVSPSTASVNEGSSVTFTVTTSNISDGTTLYWSLNTVSGTINASDFTGAAVTGSFTITSGSGSVVLALANDTTTEGSESFQLQVRTGSTSGTIVATSSTVTIGDTSLTIQASGGNVDYLAPGNGYRYHTFTSPGTFTVNSPTLTSVEIFMIGGGGGASTGGGGAGALIYRTSVPVTTTSYPISIGAGGANSDPNISFSGPAGPYPQMEGGPTTGFSFTAAGGGHGGVHNQNGNAGDPGGSGGAGAPRNGGGDASGGTASGAAGGNPGSQSPPSGWGNPGGPSHVGNPGGYGGGGGGAGGAGSNSAAGPGGAGLAYPAFAGPLIGVPSLPGTYAGGGPKTSDASTPGVGFYPTAQLLNNSGNGGGHNANGPNPSYYGSPGIVVVRYL